MSCVTAKYGSPDWTTTGKYGSEIATDQTKGPADLGSYSHKSTKRMLAPPTGSSAVAATTGAVGNLTNGANESTLPVPCAHAQFPGAQIMTLTGISTAAPASRAAKLQDISAREITRGIAAGDLSSTEAVEHFIARLQAVNGKLNAVAVDLSESTRKAAANVDKALSPRNWGRSPACRSRSRNVSILPARHRHSACRRAAVSSKAETIPMSRRCARPARSRLPRPTYRSS
jgi:hypothetical protein